MKLQYGDVTLFRQDGYCPSYSFEDRCHMVEVVGNHVILKAAGDLLAHGLDVYHEINKSCPFPGWKKGLVEDL